MFEKVGPGALGWGFQDISAACINLMLTLIPRNSSLTVETLHQPKNGPCFVVLNLSEEQKVSDIINAPVCLRSGLLMVPSHCYSQKMCKSMHTVRYNCQGKCRFAQNS